MSAIKSAIVANRHSKRIIITKFQRSTRNIDLKLHGTYSGVSDWSSWKAKHSICGERRI